MARLVEVPVSLELWQQCMTVGAEFSAKCTVGLPEGAELVNSFYEGNPPTVHLVFHHVSFENIPSGGKIPRLVPTFERLE